MQTNRDFLLTCSLRELNPEDNINTIRNALYDGAEAFMIHLEKLDEVYHNENDLKIEQIIGLSAGVILLMAIVTLLIPKRRRR